MTNVAVADGHLVMDDRAVAVVRNALLVEAKHLEDLIERSTMLLARELAPLRQLHLEITALYEQFHEAQAVGRARVPLSESATMHFRRALHRIQSDHATCTAANALRARLGASSEEMLPRTHEVGVVATELLRHVGEALPPRTLREWIASESAPRLELVQKTCGQFLETGEWLHLGVEVKAWRRRGLLADIYEEANAMWRYGRADGSRFVVRVEAFALFPDFDPYLDRVLALIRAGTERFLDGTTRAANLRAAVTESDLTTIAGDMPREKLMRFVEHVSCLGSHVPAPFSWTPDRDVLRYYPAKTYEDLVAVDQLLPSRVGTGEQCLWLLRSIADTWMETHAWPTLDQLMANEHVGPEFYYALKTLSSSWVTAVGYRFAALDLDGVILGASSAELILQAVATIVGTLADELQAGEKADVERISKLTELDPKFVRKLLPLLGRPDLGVSILSEETNPEAYALHGLAEYLDVRTPAALAERWVRNRELHRHYAVGDDKDRLNVFGVRTMRDRMLALCARGRDLRGVEQCADAKSTGPKGEAELSTHARLMRQLEGLRRPEVSPQERGRELEGIVFDILRIEKLDPGRNLLNPGEEIDLSFTLSDRHFLVECKWLKDPVDAPTVKLFMNKVRTKAEGAFGVFISMSGFVRGIDAKVGAGERLVAVGLGADDLMAVLQEKTTWVELVRNAVKAASLRARFTPVTAADAKTPAKRRRTKPRR